MRCQRLLPVAGLAVALAPASAHATEADAEAIFNQGVDDMEVGLFERACPAIEQSYTLDPRPGTLFALAECEAQRGRIATSVARYKEYLALYRQLPAVRRASQQERADIAERQVIALAPLLPTLTIRMPPGAPAGTIVRRDGQEMTDAALGVALAVDPGAHVIHVQLPGSPATEQRLMIESGERRVVVITLPSAASEGGAGVSARRIVALASGGVGIAGLTIGAITGALALGESGVVDDHCQDKGDHAVCDEAGVEAGDSLKALGTVSTVGFAVGLVGIGVSATLLLTEPSDAGADGSGVAGRGRPQPRLAARLTAVGAGAGLELRGSW